MKIQKLTKFWLGLIVENEFNLNYANKETDFAEFWTSTVLYDEVIGENVNTLLELSQIPPILTENFTLPLTSALLVPTVLFSIGVVGVVFNKRNLIFLLISLELMLLAATLNFIVFSVYFHDPIGQVYAILVLTIAAAETAIGLSIMVVTFRLKKTIDFHNFNYLRG